MKVRGKILSLLCLLGISFSVFAVVVACPDEKYFNEHPEFREGRAENFISGIGPVRVLFNNAPNREFFGSWLFARLISGVVYCIYNPSHFDNPIETPLIVVKFDSTGWKQGKNSAPWKGGICRGDRKSCYVTND